MAKQEGFVAAYSQYAARVVSGRCLIIPSRYLLTRACLNEARAVKSGNSYSISWSAAGDSGCWWVADWFAAAAGEGSVPFLVRSLVPWLSARRGFFG